MPRYFKNGSVDLIYSYLGLTHLFPFTIRTNNAMMKDATEYIQKLVQKLSFEGKLIFGTSTEHNQQEIFLALRKSLEKADVIIEGKYICITKK